jgi:osmoprotectant transport system permease protein
MITDLVRWFGDPAHWSGPDGIPQRLLEHPVTRCWRW